MEQLNLHKIKNLQMNFINQLSKNLKKKSLFAFKDNICGVDLADSQLISKFNKGIRLLLCVIDIYRKCA